MSPAIHGENHTMIFLLFEIQLSANNQHYKTARVWVNDNQHESAQALATTKLSADGCIIITIIENTTTQKDDYFPPCSSLDAFILAEQNGIAVLYS